eukprot:jgi/Galph1/3484/GphlegSOOS_G2121.1
MSSQEDVKNIKQFYQSEEERKAAQRKILMEKFGLQLEEEETMEISPVGESILTSKTDSRLFQHESTQNPSVEESSTENKHFISSQHNLHTTNVSLGTSTSLSFAESESSQTPTSSVDVVKAFNTEYQETTLNLLHRDLSPIGISVPKDEFEFVYSTHRNLDDESSQSESELRVTPITVYATALTDLNGRKISVNDKLISYAVKNHIRVLSRSSATKELLKGHTAEVIDLEFANFNSKLNLNAAINVLISTGKDGQIFVWFIEVVSDDAFHCVGHLCFRHPQIADGYFFRRVSFECNETICRLATADSETSRIFLLNTSNILKRLQDEPAAFTIMDESNEPETCLEEQDPLAEDYCHVVDMVFKDCEYILCSTTDGSLSMWHISTAKLLIKFKPFTEEDSISSLSVLKSKSVYDILVVAAASGRIIELFELMKTQSDPFNWTCSQIQRIRLDNAIESGGHFLASVDPQGEFLLLTNNKTRELIVIHIDRDEQILRADFISSFQVRQPILSFCVTRGGRKVRFVDNEDDEDASEMKTIDEIGIWCVQPKSIQYYHLYADKCRPVAQRERQDQAQVDEMTGDETYNLAGNNYRDETDLSQKTQQTLEEIDATVLQTERYKDDFSERKETLGRKETIVSNRQRIGKKSTTSVTKKKTANTTNQLLTRQNNPSSTSKPFQPLKILKKPSEIQSSSGTVTEENPVTTQADSDSSALDNIQGSSNQPSTTAFSTLTDNDSLSKISKELKDFQQMLLEELEVASKRNFERVAKELEEERIRREKLEKERVEKLLEAVSDTVNHRLEQFIGYSMEKEMQQTVIPKLQDEVSANIQKWLKSNSFQRMVTHIIEEQISLSVESFMRETFEHLCRSRLAPAFEAACQEMLKQVDVAVIAGCKEQLEIIMKKEMLNPLNGTLNTISTLTEHLQNTILKDYSDVTSKNAAVDTSDEESNVPTLSREALETQIHNLLDQNNYEGAFLLALGASNLDIVEWLCMKLDVRELFQAEEIPLSQVTLLSLVQQLGFDLKRETEMKIEWLREVLLLLETSDDMIQDYLGDTLSMLGQNLEDLIREPFDKEGRSLSVQLQRKAKVLLQICQAMQLKA